MDAKFDWKTKWQEKDSNNDTIEWIAEIPSGYVVRFIGMGNLFETNKVGASVGGGWRLLPIPPKPEVVAWDSFDDVAKSGANYLVAQDGSVYQIHNANDVGVHAFDDDGDFVFFKFPLSRDMMFAPHWSGPMSFCTKAATTSEANR